MEISEIIIKELINLGYDPKTKKIGIKPKFYYILLFYLFLESLFYTIYNWNDLEKRLAGLKEGTIFNLFVCFSIYYIFGFDIYLTMVKILKNNFFKYPFYISNERKKIYQNNNEKQILLFKINFYVCKSYFYFTNILPIFYIIILIIKGKYKYLNIEEYPVPYKFYFFDKMKSITFYLIVFLLQCILSVLFFKHGYVNYTASYNSMMLIEDELKLLSLTLKEMPDIINIITDRTKNLKNLTQNSNIINKYLKKYMSHIVQHHQHIYR